MIDQIGRQDQNAIEVAESACAEYMGNFYPGRAWNTGEPDLVAGYHISQPPPLLSPLPPPLSSPPSSTRPYFSQYIQVNIDKAKIKAPNICNPVLNLLASLQSSFEGGMSSEGDLNSGNLNILPAPTDNDTDSAYAESIKTDTTSLRSWIMEHRVENGRTYHCYKDGSYWGANDEAALEHLDIGHALYTKTFGNKLFLAPIVSEPQQILDLGTGTGIWAIDVADEYPSAVVTGTDLSPSQPSWVPPNCKFMIDDVEAEFCWEENTFDYIHIRGLHGTVRDWPRLYRQCLRALKPGGYLEQAEYSAQFTSDDNTVPEDCGISAWNRVGPECHAILKTELQVIETMGKKMREAEFDGVVEQRFKWPIGPWARKRELKELGRYARLHVDPG
ncbi:hypothetical protein OHC33_011254 [Knufia fluminis]|uniref:S-adenosyl-L-methionine-dependent methyltransferase n=1 Tax=Knufia fluminis TaxID=191047 RepID=A0AAN8EI97_9EURO|nr:hypothetical protein OHC33_011254 [Knufia fluminis]